MCVACKSMKPKKEMLRVVKDADGNISIDPTKKIQGRGAYVCNSQECIAKCTKGKLLNRAFKGNVDSEVYVNLKGNNE